MIIACPDQPGIVRAVTDMLFRAGANISFLEQHIEDGFFFMRAEWEGGATIADLTAQMQPIRAQFQMEVTLDAGERRKRVGLFCSKEGHCLVDILGRVSTGELPVDISYVISNADACRHMVESFGIPFHLIDTPATAKNAKDRAPKQAAARRAHEAACLKIVSAHPTDVIGLARYMKILSAEFIRAVGQRIINVHHSFLPSFVGARPYDEAHERGVKLIGATAHYVTPELDQGPIIEQAVLRVKHTHRVEDLKMLGRESEKQVFAFALRKHIDNKLVVYKNRTVVFD